MGRKELRGTRRRRLSPRQERIAYQVWAIAQALGWNMTYQEMADRLEDVSVLELSKVMYFRGWGKRLRRSKYTRVDKLDSYNAMYLDRSLGVLRKY